MILKIFLLLAIITLPVFVYWQYQLYKEVPTIKEFGVELPNACKSSATCAFGNFCQPLTLKQTSSGALIKLKATDEFNVCVPYIYKTFQAVGVETKK